MARLDEAAAEFAGAGWKVSGDANALGHLDRAKALGLPQAFDTVSELQQQVALED
ncbi:hypothetical protein LJR296_006804 [Cupriavidus necator]